MTVVKEANCDSGKVTQLVTSLVEGAKWVTDVGAELSFTLPSAKSASFPTMFETLEGLFCSLINGGPLTFNCD